MSLLTVQDLSFTYAGTSLSSLERVSFALTNGQVLSLIGESGSGKSTLLRLIAGFEKPKQGAVMLDGEELSGLSNFVRPEHRGIGLISQSGDLFPHLTIAQNITYGLKGKGHEALTSDLLSKVQLSGYEKKFPGELSGGEKQRIALIRALALKPRLLLLDEPFSSLDTRLRAELLELTFDLLRKEGMTAIFITHHSLDALRVGDQVGVLHNGDLIQIDRPEVVWETPATPQVAKLFYEINDYEALPKGLREKAKLPSWGKVSALKLKRNPTDKDLVARIEKVEFLGNQHLLTLSLEDGSHLRALSEDGWEPGDEVAVSAG